MPADYRSRTRRPTRAARALRRRRRRRRNKVFATFLLVVSGCAALLAHTDLAARAQASIEHYVAAPASGGEDPEAAGAPYVAPVVGGRDRKVQKAGRGAGRCAAGPAHQAVERYLASHPEFGVAVADGQTSTAECSTITKFQSWAGMQSPSGVADAVTGDVVRRLSAVRTDACEAKTGTTVCVDLTSQTMWAFRDGTLVLQPTVVRTGRAGEQTPTGWYEITQKKRHTVSSEFGTPLPYWQRFHLAFGFHQAETYMYANIPGSHGCVNMLERDASALFALTEMGTKVHLFGRKPGT